MPTTSSISLKLTENGMPVKSESMKGFNLLTKLLTLIQLVVISRLMVGKAKMLVSLSRMMKETLLS